MQARFYEPATGRFTQNDPLAYQFSDFRTGQNNRWTYCGSDPVNASDPSGLTAQIIVAGIIGAVLAGILGGITGGWRGFFGGLFSGAVSGVLGALGYFLWAGALGAMISGFINGDSVMSLVFKTLFGIGLGVVGSKCISALDDAARDLEWGIFSVDVELWIDVWL